MGALDGLKAIVAGGGRGIGRSIALAFANEGADVAVVGRDDESLSAVADEIQALGRRAVAASQDLKVVDEIPGLFDRLIEQLGGIDILVNSAGVQITGPSLEVTEEQWDETLDANLKSMFFSCQAAGRQFMIAGARKDHQPRLHIQLRRLSRIRRVLLVQGRSGASNQDTCGGMGSVGRERERHSPHRGQHRDERLSTR